MVARDCDDERERHCASLVHYSLFYSPPQDKRAAGTDEHTQKSQRTATHCAIFGHPRRKTTIVRETAVLRRTVSSRMSVITVLQPQMTCDKILTVSKNLAGPSLFGYRPIESTQKMFQSCAVTWIQIRRFSLRFPSCTANFMSYPSYYLVHHEIITLLKSYGV